MNQPDLRSTASQPATGPGSALAALTTPALLVDLDQMEANLHTMAHFFREGPCKLRPHIKNHRSLTLAHRQLAAGAIGMTCATVDEAELLAGDGIQSILLANEVSSAVKLKRLVDLARQTDLILAVDNVRVVKALETLVGNRPTRLRLLVDMNLGLDRCGVPSGADALNLARTIVGSGLTLGGLMGYEGHLQKLPPGSNKEQAVRLASTVLTDTRRQFERAGLAVDIVSTGGTGTYATAGRTPGITEVQAGNYLLMDTSYAPAAPDFQPALSLLVTVISKTPGERIVVDTGIKRISAERGMPTVQHQPGLRLTTLHGDHGIIALDDPTAPVEVGDPLRLAVHYSDGTINLHHTLYGIRNGLLEETFTLLPYSNA